MISFAFSLLITLLSLFVNAVVYAAAYVNIVDGFIVSMSAAWAVYRHAHWHPAFCLLVFIASWIVVAMIQMRSIGYWILSVIFSIGYSFTIAKSVYASTHHDMIWGSVIGGLSLIIFLALHKVRSPNNN